MRKWQIGLLLVLWLVLGVTTTMVNNLHPGGAGTEHGEAVEH